MPAAVMFALLSLKTTSAQTYHAKLLPISGSGSSATGEITLFKETAGLAILGFASNMEANLSGSCTAKNCRGIHMHSGTKCTDSTTQGGHLYSGSTDPWTNISYASTDAEGVAKFYVIMPNFGDAIAGKVFVIHKNDGGRVACGVVTEQTSNVANAPLNAIKTSDKYAGQVYTYMSGNMIYGAGYGSGLTANVAYAKDCTATNGCGAHVHSGTACTDATSQGGHYYGGSVTADPWTVTGYRSTDTSGVANFMFMLDVGVSSVAGKPFVLHQTDGSRVACGVLRAPTKESSGKVSGSGSVAPGLVAALMLLIAFARL